MTQRPTIGFQEYVTLPVWGVGRLLAKSDTGARSSALDAKNIVEFSTPSGDHVRFDIVLSRSRRDRTVTVEAPIARRTRVRSSHGHTTQRIVVLAPLRIGDTEKTIEVTLVSRKPMICRMLLGRSALAGTFLVDSENRFLLSEPRRKKTNQDGTAKTRRTRSQTDPT